MVFRPKKTASIIFTGIIIFLALPATAILASWNALPYSFLYPVKRGLEKTALALVPQSFLESELRIKLIDRRTQEATAVLIETPHDTQALDALLAEAQAAQYNTVQLQSTQKQKASRNLVNSLKKTNQQLETTKQTIIDSTTVVYKTEIIYQTTSKEIENTQEEIEEIIEKVEQETITGAEYDNSILQQNAEPENSPNPSPEVKQTIASPSPSPEPSPEPSPITPSPALKTWPSNNPRNQPDFNP